MIYALVRLKFFFHVNLELNAFFRTVMRTAFQWTRIPRLSGLGPLATTAGGAPGGAPLVKQRESSQSVGILGYFADIRRGEEKASMM